ISPETALSHLEIVTLAGEDARRWCQGQRLSLPEISQKYTFGKKRVQQENGQFLGVGEIVNSDTKQVLIPQLVFEPIS
ncbi:MAG TPA: tRNA pseudouridine(55) synthase TruB, partial [Phormidium sp.]